jgi:hypothetical protein
MQRQERKEKEEAQANACEYNLLTTALLPHLRLGKDLMMCTRLRGLLTYTIFSGGKGGLLGGVGGVSAVNKTGDWSSNSSREDGEVRGEGVRGVLHPPRPSSSLSATLVSVGVCVFPSDKIILPRLLILVFLGLSSASRALEAVLSAEVPRRLSWRSSFRISRKYDSSASMKREV